LVPQARDARPTPTSTATGGDAGVPDTATSNEPVTLPLIYNVADAAASGLASALRDQLQASNITLDLAGLDQATWQTRLAGGDFDLALVDGPRWPDPSGLRDLVGGNGRDNFWSYANSEVDDLFTAADEATDATTRAAMFAELEQVLAADAPLLPLLSPSTSYAFTDRATGLPYDLTRARPDRHRFNLARLSRPSG
jgi:ABC-type transport system substrate-binding protein